MLVMQSLSAGAARYYFEGQGPGRWVGHGAASLGLSGAVVLRDLRALLEGRDPATRQFLPAHRPARRRAGWDLVFAAPKSVSLLAATPRLGHVVCAAHSHAVDAVVEHMEQTLLEGRGAIGACFEHHTNAAGEAHIHSHLVLVNLTQNNAGGWGTLRGWWPSRRSLSALYQLGLRQQVRLALAELDVGDGSGQSPGVGWWLHGDGLADLAGVPRAAIRAASSRSISLRAAFGSAQVTSTGAALRARRAAAGRSRPVLPPGLTGVAPAALTGVAPAGLTGVAPAGVAPGFAPAGPAVGVQPASLPAAGAQELDLKQRVATWLAQRRSSFSQRDVLVALAACCAAGCDPPAAERFAAEFCARCLPALRSPSGVARFTTGLAASVDARILTVESVWAHPPEPFGEALIAEVFAEHNWLDSSGTAAVRRLLAGSRPIELLEAPAGRSNLLAHAAVLDAAACAWSKAGLRVKLVTTPGLSPLRWEALTCLGAERRLGHDVLVVDGADRLASPALVSLLEDAALRGNRVVLVEGGTSPRLSWRWSDALTIMGDRLGRLNPGRAPAWVPDASLAAGAGVSTPPSLAAGAGVSAPPSLAAGAGVSAARRLVAAWAAFEASEGQGTLVGLGPAEVSGLNAAARSLLEAGGRLGGPVLEVKGRCFQAGDQVVALRQIAVGVPAASRGTVLEVDARRGALETRFGSQRLRLEPGGVAQLGYGYAVTASIARRVPGPLMILGPPEAAGPARTRVLVAEMPLGLPGREHGLVLGL
jgi:conjugative relaxase-like TrwC/TraI family protein